MLSLCPFDISVGVGAFVIGLGQISSFLSLSQDCQSVRQSHRIVTLPGMFVMRHLYIFYLYLIKYVPHITLYSGIVSKIFWLSS